MGFTLHFIKINRSLIRKEIERLEKRKEMALFQRKITTQISVVWEYDQELLDIDNKLLELKESLNCG